MDTSCLKKIFIEEYKSLNGNNFTTLGEPDVLSWEEPLIGIASGDDEYLASLKEHIGQRHLTPQEMFAVRYKEAVEPKTLRVVSLVFPQSQITKEEQARARNFPGDHWVVSRGEWEPLMREYAGKVQCRLDEESVRNIFVDTDILAKEEWSSSVNLKYSWSHRHGAYASGLGTFGLSDAFISKRGKANRITTVIVEGDFEVTPRDYRGLYDWCLYHAKGICGACIRRCPVRAISERGHDLEKCCAYEDDIEVRLWPEHLEKKDYMFGCGLCQVKIPCQDKRP